MSTICTNPGYMNKVQIFVEYKWFVWVEPGADEDCDDDGFGGSNPVADDRERLFASPRDHQSMLQMISGLQRIGPPPTDKLAFQDRATSRDFLNEVGTTAEHEKAFQESLDKAMRVIYDEGTHDEFVAFLDRPSHQEPLSLPTRTSLKKLKRPTRCFHWSQT